MSEHKRYQLLSDHRHYKKGDEVLLRDHVAEALREAGKIGDPIDESTPEAKKSRRQRSRKKDD